MQTTRHQALAHLKQALDLWEVDPDEASLEEQQAWENAHEAAIMLAKMLGEAKPGAEDNF